jgi:hypothetical protein
LAPNRTRFSFRPQCERRGIIAQAAPAHRRCGYAQATARASWIAGSLATGITNFLENDGTLKAAQRIAGHADSRTRKLYDRGSKDFARSYREDSLLISKTLPDKGDKKHFNLLFEHE